MVIVQAAIGKGKTLTWIYGAFSDKANEKMTTTKKIFTEQYGCGLRPKHMQKKTEVIHRQTTIIIIRTRFADEQRERDERLSGLTNLDIYLYSNLLFNMIMLVQERSMMYRRKHLRPG